MCVSDETMNENTEFNRDDIEQDAAREHVAQSDNNAIECPMEEWRGGSEGEGGINPIASSARQQYDG